ncbi:MAG: hypothetical protein KDK99_09885 [Verrucomicrobiales bacterium]|nr:hypothetical protein [Verrucomicrobiales bacterium]
MNAWKRFYERVPILGDLMMIRRATVKAAHEAELSRTMMACYLTERLIAEDQRSNPDKRLLRKAHQCCSQNGEDGMIGEILNRVGTSNCSFLEIGVGNGMENNTAYLLALGWTGFWIDGSTEFLKAADFWNHQSPGCVKARQSFVTKANVSDVVANMGVPIEIDLLSVDIDQNTYYIWESLAHLRPRVAVIEYNANITPETEWKVSYSDSRCWDGSLNFGASLKALEMLGERLGYALVGCNITGVNAFFVRNDLVGDHFEPPFTAENHFEPPRYSLGFRGGHRLNLLDRINT